MRSVTFEAGGRELALRMDMNALARYQDRSSETISAAIDAIMKDGWDITRGRRLFWAGLTVRMTEEEVGDLMTEIGMGRALELAGEALRYAIRSLNGDPEEEPGNAPEPRTTET